MASASGIRAGAAYVELTVNDNQLVAGMAKASKLLQSFGEKLTGIGTGAAAVGAAITAPFVAATKIFSDTGDQLDKMAKRTGFSVESLSALAYGAEMSGASLEDVGTGIKYMQKNLTDAARGGAAANAAFARLGVSVDALMAMSPEEQFAAVGQALSEIKDPAEKTELAMTLLGRSGTQLLPLAADMKALAVEAKKMGVVMSTQDSQAAAELNDAIGRVMIQVKMLAVAVGSALMPVLMEWASWLRQTVADVSAWVNENETLVKVIAGIGVALAAAGVGLVGFGMALNGLGGAVGVIASVTKGIWGMVAAVAALDFASLPALITSFATALAGAANAMKGFSVASALASAGGMFTKIGAWVGSAGALTSSLSMAGSSMAAFAMAAAPIAGVLIAIAGAAALVAYDISLLSDISDAKKTIAETTAEIQRMDKALRDMDAARGGGKAMTFDKAKADVESYVESLIKAGKSKQEVEALLQTRRASESARAEDTKGPWDKSKAFSQEYYEGMQNESRQMMAALDSTINKGLDGYKRMFDQVAEGHALLTEMEKAEQDKRAKADMVAQAKRTGAMKKALDDRKKATEEFNNWLTEQGQQKQQKASTDNIKDVEKTDPLEAVRMASAGYESSLKAANEKVATAQKLLADALANPESDVRRGANGEVEIANNEEVQAAVASAKAAYQVAEDQRQLMEDATRAAIAAQAKAAEASKSFEERYAGMQADRAKDAEQRGFDQKLNAAKGSPEAMKALESETDTRLANAVAQAARMRDEVRRLFAQAENTGSEADLEKAKAASDEALNAERQVDVMRNRLLRVGESADSQMNQKMDVTGSFSAAAAAGLGLGSSAADRTAKATEETAKNTKRLIEKLDSGVSTFS